MSLDDELRELNEFFAGKPPPPGLTRNATQPNDGLRRERIRLVSLLWWVMEEKMIRLQRRTYQPAFQRAEARALRRRRMLSAMVIHNAETEAGRYLDEEIDEQSQLLSEAVELAKELGQRCYGPLIGNEHFPWNAPRTR